VLSLETAKMQHIWRTMISTARSCAGERSREVSADSESLYRRKMKESTEPRPTKETIVLDTERLRLRPLCHADVPALLPLIGAREVAATTLRIPHPYTLEDATKFLEYSEGIWNRAEGARFGVFLREKEILCGGIGLATSREHNQAELGYWIGVPFWGNGYCSEAVREVLKYGFGNLRLNRIHSGHFSINPASGRILRKVGMKHEGTLRQHICKWGEYMDLEVYGLLASEFPIIGSPSVP
jgi:RimJ/RimL family protein N-acetyltransferase